MCFRGLFLGLEWAVVSLTPLFLWSLFVGREVVLGFFFSLPLLAF